VFEVYFYFLHRRVVTHPVAPDHFYPNQLAQKMPKAPRQTPSGRGRRRRRCVPLPGHLAATFANRFFGFESVFFRGGGRRFRAQGGALGALGALGI
jgi:hypothetical protein